MTAAQNKGPPHTPGPCTIRYGHLIYSTKQGEIANVRGAVQRGQRAEDDANASLIAAAPDLLDALQNFMNGVETGLVRVESNAAETLANALTKIHRALAKAKGVA
ncbi:MAG: hypothetical protein WAL34_04240 [Acidobacteriaceae bacterium]